jgi:hypothetical protein
MGQGRGGDGYWPARQKRRQPGPRTLSLFPEDRCATALADASTVHVKLSQSQLRRPRQWGACWLALPSARLMLACSWRTMAVFPSPDSDTEEPCSTG